MKVFLAWSGFPSEVTRSDEEVSAFRGVGTTYMDICGKERTEDERYAVAKDVSPRQEIEA